MQLSASLLAELSDALPDDGLIRKPAQLQAYSCDALTMYKQLPLCVALPRDEKQVAAVLKIASARQVPVVTRGAGTGLSGGAMPHEQGILLVTARMNSIVHVDPLVRTATVQPGVANLAISEAASRYGLFYAPDPSSQVACSIGGNVAENSGGVRCLKYGLTVHNVERIRCLTIAGEAVEFGGPDAVGYDLLALLHGSEGMLAAITEITVRLVAKPAATRTMLVAFDDVQAAGDAVADIIAAGLLPAGLEMMDQLSVELIEEFVNVGYPTDAAMLLLCETDGTDADAQEQMDRLREICQARGGASFRLAQDEYERTQMWLGRKSALPAVGRRFTDFYCIDGTIPRRALGKITTRIAQLSRKYGIACANVFHAGDGNLHPLLMFNAGDAEQAAAARDLGSEILLACLEVGGTITGEHGVGIEKIGEMCVQFSKAELECFRQLRRAFDPNELLNPDKAIPTLQRCAEFGKEHVRVGHEKFPELERF